MPFPPEASTRSLNVLLYGLSANPPTNHRGHAGLVRHFAQLGSFDEVWVLPVFVHPYRSKKRLAPFDHRLAMSRLCFEPESTPECAVRVLPLERDLYELHERKALEAAAAAGGAPARARTTTADLLEELHRRYPTCRWSLLLGGDTFNDVMANKWTRSARVRELASLEVVLRPGVPLSHAPPSSTSCAVHRVEGVEDVSSTLARAAPPRRLERLLCPAVARYVREHELYNYSPAARAARMRRGLATAAWWLLVAAVVVRRGA